MILAAAALGLVVVATALAAPADRGPQQVAPLAASHQPTSPDDDGPPTQAELERIVGKLSNASVNVDVATLRALAADHGVGGAVRLLAWAQASGRSTGNLAAMHASGRGWGEIAKELDLHPGIGWIMGGGQGHGRANAPGQQKSR
ncbi:MAG TPA: hypothetical protein VHK63_02625 [Candidatus Limnocylindria bacterium]|nr:hypothetical protein [Candidatus Limnocylindria bacterium]